VTRVELHIDELVLDGFDPHDRARLTASLRDELMRMGAEHGAPDAQLAQHAPALTRAVQQETDRS
jgi:hypothetical protein